MNTKKLIGEVVDVVVGMAAGAGDQGVQIWDDNRASKYATDNPGKELSHWKQGGTYLNFVAPALAVVGVGLMNEKLSDVNIARITGVSGQLAGRKLVHRFAKVNAQPISPAPYAEFRRAAERAAAAAALEAAGRNVYVPRPNPQPIFMGESTPVVTPQGLAGGGGLG
jgi:hypothetical protein